MKHILVISICCCYHFIASAQLSVDTTYNSTYYVQKTTLFRLLPDTKHEIIFLGNSITDIGEWAEIWNNHHVKNRGISGDNTFGVLARLDEVVSSKPTKIFIMIGINDIARDTPDSIILANYKKIIERIRNESPKTIIIVQSILPTNNEFTDFKNHQNKDTHIQWFNGQLMAYCKAAKIRFINLYPSFLDNNNKLSRSFTNDGLHLNGDGYMKWKEILIQEKLMK
ncbi:MAG: GDSL-type esterase/lipase family protein [Chitinophagaceae bacterium]